LLGNRSQAQLKWAAVEKKYCRKNEQVGNLLSLVSKFLGFSFGKKTVVVQEFKFVYSKAIENCPG
jgi:hypothetical protein